MFDFKIRKTYFAIAFIILEVVSIYYWDDSFKAKLNFFYNQKFEEQGRAYIVTQDMYNLVARTYFEQAINDSSVIRILRQAQTKDEISRAGAREKLQSYLSGKYGDLKSNQLKQLNFFLPNNETLLRFQTPEIHSDNVTNQRAAIKKTNEQKRIISGFEESRHFNGFRYVFPIFDAKRSYLGCVEIGVGMNTIREEMMKILKVNLGFVIHRKAAGVTAMDLSLGNSNYLRSDIHTRYLYESSVFNVAQHIYVDQIDIKIRQEINRVLQTIAYRDINRKRAFAKTVPYKEKFYTAVFQPISNVNNKHVAYLIGYSQNNQFEGLRSNFYLGVISTTFAWLMVLGFIYFENRNIRRIRLNNKEMKQQTWELRKLNNTKEKFLSFVADDLKNPFHFLKGYALALLEDFENMPKEKVHHYLTLIFQASENGNHLVENLLEWSRLQKSTAEYKPTFMYISDVIDEVIADYYHIAEEKKISFYSTVNKKETNRVYADKSNTTSLLRNLVSNALKYTQEGGIVIISAKNISKHLEITVKDNGIGMKPKVVQTLFSTGKEAQDEKHSAKLGLILSKELAERNQGQLRVESIEGKGSSFIFTLPNDRPYRLFKRSFRGTEVSA